MQSRCLFLLKVSIVFIIKRKPTHLTTSTRNILTLKHQIILAVKTLTKTTEIFLINDFSLHSVNHDNLRLFPCSPLGGAI